MTPVDKADLERAVCIAVSYVPIDPARLFRGETMDALQQHDAFLRIDHIFDDRGWAVVRRDRIDALEAELEAARQDAETHARREAKALLGLTLLRRLLANGKNR